MPHDFEAQSVLSSAETSGKLRCDEANGHLPGGDLFAHAIAFSIHVY
jgi:hypothetical protein